MRTDNYGDFAFAKGLDPAATLSFTENNRINAEAGLREILATGRPTPRASANRAPQLNRNWRWAAVPVAAAAAIGLGIGLPGAPGIAPAQASMLTWTAIATSLTDSEMAEADAVCRTEINEFLVKRNADVAEIPGAPGSGKPVSLLEQPTVAERRGEWGLLGYPQDGDLAICFVWFSNDGPQMSLFESLGGGGASGPIVGSPGSGSLMRAMGGLTGDQLSVDPGFDQIDVRATTEITIPDDAQVIPPPSGFFTLFGGRVGEDVEGLTLHTITGGDVEATVANGWWIAWWPGAMGGDDYYLAYKRTANLGVDGWGNPEDPLTFWENAGDAAIYGYTTTLTDGTTASFDGDWGGCEAFNEIAATWDDVDAACFYNRAEAEAQLEIYRAELAAAESAE